MLLLWGLQKLSNIDFPWTTKSPVSGFSNNENQTCNRTPGNLRAVSFEIAKLIFFWGILELLWGYFCSLSLSLSFTFGFIPEVRGTFATMGHSCHSGYICATSVCCESPPLPPWPHSYPSLTSSTNLHLGLPHFLLLGGFIFSNLCPTYTIKETLAM